MFSMARLKSEEFVQPFKNTRNLCLCSGFRSPSRCQDYKVGLISLIFTPPVVAKWGEVECLLFSVYVSRELSCTVW